MHEITRLQRIPKISLTDAPPLHPSLENSYQEKIRDLEQDPHLFNGLCTVATLVEPEAISAYTMDFARGLLYTTPPEGRFLSVGCQLFDPRGYLLWTRRGMHVAEHPDLWEPGVSGTMDQVGDPEQLMLIELNQELNIEPKINFIGLSEGQSHCQLTWIAYVESDQPEAQKPELSDLAWLPPGQMPDQDTVPVSPALISRYAEIARLLKP